MQINVDDRGAMLIVAGGLAAVALAFFPEATADVIDSIMGAF